LKGISFEEIMRILNQEITLNELKSIAAETFGDLVKAVVDIDKELVAIDAELHSDLEALFLENGSLQKSLWGINFYPDLQGDDFVEFDSMINMRPSQGNLSRGIDDENLQKKVIEIIKKWVRQ